MTPAICLAPTAVLPSQILIPGANPLTVLHTSLHPEPAFWGPDLPEPSYPLVLLPSLCPPPHSPQGPQTLPTPLPIMLLALCPFRMENTVPSSYK